eukprot:6206319-Pleurochrysis_carterae.AAC.1
MRSKAHVQAQRERQDAFKVAFCCLLFCCVPRFHLDTSLLPFLSSSSAWTGVCVRACVTSPLSHPISTLREFLMSFAHGGDLPVRSTAREAEFSHPEG